MYTDEMFITALVDGEFLTWEELVFEAWLQDEKANNELEASCG